MRNEPPIDAPTDLYIDGKFRPASDGGRFEVYDPATEEVIAEVADGTVEDAIAAVDAAAEAFDGWAAQAARASAARCCAKASSSSTRRRNISPG